MRRFSAVLISTLALGTILASTGCAEQHRGTYDPYYHDYHRWNAGEEVYYKQWVGERHYEYVEYRHQRADRQKEYWRWRHDHEHDHDKG